ncbi:hypothetical protein HRbin16_00700 [bacterium HR16]|nr:hypothetical protein HRbin16_00700 [bacterium HR16]
MERAVLSLDGVSLLADSSTRASGKPAHVIEFRRTQAGKASIRGKHIAVPLKDSVVTVFWYVHESDWQKGREEMERIVKTILTLARHPLIVLSLLSAGADPNVRGSTGATPLLAAVERGEKAIAKILLEHGADVNRGTDSGVTPLMIASRDGRLDLVQLLLSHGADVTLHDQRGFTAVDFVKGKRGAEYRAIQQLLKRATTMARNH